VAGHASGQQVIVRPPATHNRHPDGSCQLRTKLDITLALLLGCTAASATTCEPLRLEIESKIKGAGVTGFSITTVEASASAPGKVVGTCDQGSMKIVYLRLQPASGGAPAVPAPANSVPAKRGADAIVTECKDGSVVTNGDCKK
jgi:hypothetical protein